jgi:hypothetical protein
MREDMGFLYQAAQLRFVSTHDLVASLKAFARSNKAPAERLCHVSTIQMLPVQGLTGRVALTVLDSTVKRA